MRQRTVAIATLSVSLVAVCALAMTAGLLSSVQPAGAGTATLPGAPTGLQASPGRRAGAGVNFEEPALNAGSPIKFNTATATDLTNPAHGGQIATAVGVPYGNSDVIAFSKLTVGDRYTFRVTATNSVGTGPASAPSNVVIPTPPPPPRGVYCEHATGTTSGVVALSSCSTGTGTLPGATLKGTRTGKITWTQGAQSYSTTIAITTTLIPNTETSGYCAKQSLGGAYLVHGKVTANSNPRTAVGASVSAYLCISASGVVRQDHYGHFAF
jgi:hypothetical protein